MSIDYDNLTDEEYEETIADFLWPDNFEIFTVFVFLSLMTIGVSGNCLVVFVVIRNKKLVIIGGKKRNNSYSFSGRRSQRIDCVIVMRSAQLSAAVWAK
ncbi:hypothetical protein Tcan_18125 [Toxocara canis]|uniref:G_PROTEIN_RECEP_F1_2 domain-containing protein n=2 Tax=Toxocara canis TaxID=6265 RepID=A0A0B2W572_TOXCA|nr:hypothetical protein Tcan_18125 [Toxocara canis]VDM38002.1 unnamed protein product [Toxocara canis]